MTKKKLTELEQELSLALQVASTRNAQSKCSAWGVSSPFQKKINELLKKSGRKKNSNKEHGK